MTIEEFIRARLDEDEATARAATELPRVTPKYPAKRPAWEPERWEVDMFDDVRTVNGATDPILIDPSSGGVRSRHVADHIAQNDPDTVLSDIAGKRKILTAAERVEENGGWHISGQGVEIIYALAERWKTHPDFQPGWA
ncbi:DUF6221 family protein [Nocardia halotolerans]|uniref:DUF6221 family protein n=1 Tax=Nocardia halotolerans TaxID=1755878 RepID=A0ABV8VBI1_9NOCA